MNTAYFLYKSAYSNQSSAQTENFDFGSNLPIKVFPVKNRKKDHPHGISLGTKFQLKLKIFSFWTKFIQKKYFQLETEQAVQGPQVFAFWVVNVNSTVVFKHFDDVRDFIFLNILKQKLVVSYLLASFLAMISKVMIEFRSKFQFRIPLQFQRTVEKVETCDYNGQKF